MTNPPPHKTLMLLHQMLDRALTPLLAPMGLEHATEGYVTVPREQLDALVTAHGDPQAALVGFGPRVVANGMMIAEPALASAVLSRIWRSDRNEGAPLTQVEGEILRQFMARMVEAWRGAWAQEGITTLPEFAMAGALSMLRPQITEGKWHVARCVVREQGSTTGGPLGVLLFCYPEAVMPLLTNDARSTMWRSRVERGLTEADRAQLHQRLAGALRDVSITAPVRISQHMTLGMLNSLERGDIVAFDEGAQGDITFSVLGREVTGRLAGCGEQLALALSGPAAETPDFVPGGADFGVDQQPPDPQHFPSPIDDFSQAI